MTHHIIDLLRGLLVHYGYWAVAGALLLESAGLPLPGETVLLLASFLSYSEHDLRFPWIILVGTVAATLGGEIGFAVGRHGGRQLIERYREVLHVRREAITRGEFLFDHYGEATILLARFIFGMRVLASLLAGALRMRWRNFILFNFLGAALWVTTICGAGYMFGGHWSRLTQDLKRLDLVITVIFVVAGLWWWWKRRRAQLSG